MTELLFVVIAFLSGSLMFSLWVGKLALRRDIRAVGDGNPGAFNLIATSKGWGAVGALLDAFKGCIPVGIAKWVFVISGTPLALIAIAPLLGHAFSPWLRFRGGKAVAVTFGVWTGLTLWEGPTILGVLLGVWFSVVTVSGHVVMLVMGCLGAYWLLTNRDPVYLTVWVVNTLLLAYKYRADFSKPLDLRASFKERLWRST
ncbi:MAG: glycerol-3-phosphate acyltransferase [Chloroflexota bacterium]|nr:glycerol-3-phosphate acyltransferase [Chloroflexota bacterium]